MDRGGRFLPDHFRPWTVGDGSFRTIFGRAAMHGLFSYFLRFFGDVSFLTHLFLDNEGAGVLGCRGAGVPGSRVPEVPEGCRKPEECRK